MTARLDRPPRFAATLTRRALLEAGALVVGFGFAPGRRWRKRSALPMRSRNLPLDQVDSFLAIRGDGTVVVYSGKVDLGTGHRIAMRQMVGEELGDRCRSHRADRGRHRADAEPGADRRQQRHHARRRRAAPGRGDGTRGAAGAGGRSGCSCRSPS